MFKPYAYAHRFCSLNLASVTTYYLALGIGTKAHIGGSCNCLCHIHARFCELDLQTAVAVC